MTTFNRDNLPAGTVLLNRRVRIITPFPSLSPDEIARLTGQTGVCKWDVPDSDGDIYVELDASMENGRTTSYVRAWEFLDGDEALTSSEPVDKTDAEERLEALLDAIYETALARGYQSHLRPLMEQADIPMRPAQRTLTLKGTRVVSTDRYEVNQALAAVRLGTDEETVVTTSRVLAEFVVKVPFPGESTDSCYQVTNDLRDNNWAGIPDEVLTRAARAVGVSGGPETLRTWLSRTVEKDASHAPVATCVYC